MRSLTRPSLIFAPAEKKYCTSCGGAHEPLKNECIIIIIVVVVAGVVVIMYLTHLPPRHPGKQQIARRRSPLQPVCLSVSLAAVRASFVCNYGHFMC